MHFKTLREKNNLTQKQLADIIGVHKITIAKWECGMSEPSGMAVFALSRALECEPEHIYRAVKASRKKLLAPELA